jgi:hypothetical protein
VSPPTSSVFSHYEFEASADVRLTNGEWQAQLREGQVPAAAEWTASYRAAGVNAEAPQYGRDPDWP